MTSPSDDLVIQALRRPERLPAWPLPAWEQLVRQARRADLLARIAGMLGESGLIDKVPPQPRAHLDAARILAIAQEREVRREVEHVRRAIEPTGAHTVLLKGAAYVMAGLPAAEGRTFSDIDILVPRGRLAEVEAALMLGGWATTHHSAYDQRYYREWMHELPPLQHIHRHTVVDVHHAILPDTARLKPSSRKLLAASQALDGPGGLHVLEPRDMVLHSMAHLFHNEEMSHALRDLSDLDLLLRHFSGDAGFWERLIGRARELDLARPLHYGLRYANRVLGTPAPREMLELAARAAAPWPLSRAMDGLWLRALRSPPPRAGDPLTATSLFLLYVRAHWLRMPPGLLLRHLLVKGLRRGEARERA